MSDGDKCGSANSNEFMRYMYILFIIYFHVRIGMPSVRVGQHTHTHTHKIPSHDMAEIRSGHDGPVDLSHVQVRPILGIDVDGLLQEAAGDALVQVQRDLSLGSRSWKP